MSGYIITNVLNTVSLLNTRPPSLLDQFLLTRFLLICLLVFIFVVHVLLILLHSILIIVLFVLVPVSATCTAAPIALDGLLRLTHYTLVVTSFPICLVSCLLVPPVVSVQVVHVVLESQLVQGV
jgi:hypothetical protein